MSIIEELDKENINLQETRLNLKHQGYEMIYDLWLRGIINQAINERQLEIIEEMLKSI